MAGGMFASHYESGGDIIEVNGKLFKQFYGTYTVVYVSSTIIYWYLELLFLSNLPISIRTALSKLCPLFWPNLPLLVLYLYILDQALHSSVLTIQCTLRFPYWLSLSVSCTSFDRHVIWCRDGKAFRGSGRIQVKRGQSSHASLQRSFLLRLSTSFYLYISLSHFIPLPLSTHGFISFSPFSVDLH